MERSIASEHSVGERDLGFLKGAALSAAGFLLGLTRLFGYPAPFAAACIASANGLGSVFLFVGAAAGYTINGGLETCVHYITAMGVLTILKLVTGIFAPKKTSEFFRIIMSAAAGLAVFAANFLGAHGVYEIFISAAFAVIASVFAYCADKLRDTGLRTAVSGQKTGSAAAVCVLFVLLTAALTSLQIGVINAGVFLSVLAVLYSSEVKAGAMSAVCAVLSSAGVAAGNTDFAASCIMISVSAPVIMLLGKYGKITRSCAFIFTVSAGLIITGMTETNGTAAMSAIAASVLYMIIPERFSPLAAFADKPELVSASSSYSAFGDKLAYMSETVDEMRSAVIRTADALESDNIRDISWVYNKAADKICKSCPSNMKCWGKMYNETADVMNKAVGMLRKGSFLSASDLGAHIGSSCPERERLAEALNKQYAVYCSAESASRKVAEMRNVLTAQLGATGKMLKKMSEDIGSCDAYDEEAAAKAGSVFSDAGLYKPSVIAMVINSRLCIDAYGKGDLRISPDELADRLSFALRHEFDLPVITEGAERNHITISERAKYDAQIKVFRRNRAGSSYSGDCSECFNDGRGSVYMILSDGMGTGSRARIDSAFSCGMLTKMLKAGIDLDASLEMLNTSLLVKSADESFATLDLCRIDLNTGDVLLCKAGGASTYVRCGETFAEIGEEGIPLGISFEADYRGKLFRISEGDIIIMTSDGAEFDKTWLEQIVMRDKNADIGSIVETAGEALRLSADKNEDDDMTVIGVKLIR